MGILTNLLIANESDSQLLAEDTGTFSAYEKVSLNGLTNVELESLAEIILGQIIELELRGEASENGPWVFVLPTKLTTTLAELLNKDLSSIAVQWTSTDELSRGGVSPKIAQQALSEVINLAVKAVAVKKELLLSVGL
jgi:hypothetical protein